jgi:hypothetical protein
LDFSDALLTPTHNSGSILVITLYAAPKAMKPIQSHNFISINPVEKNKDGVTQWLGDFSYSVTPVPCHSHNDYSRPYPLFSALVAGCMSVEADVWLSQNGNDLLVGHSQYTLSATRTLQTLYIDPLLKILDQVNTRDTSLPGGQRHGVFRTQPQQTLLLFIDVKDDATATWPVVVRQLQSLGDKAYLTRVNANSSAYSNYTRANGPVTVIGTGNILPTNKILGQGCAALTQSNDTFLDASLDKLTHPESFGYLASCQTESFLGLPVAKFYTASASLGNLIGSVRSGFSSGQLAQLRRTIQAAKSRNLLSRYWGTPSWPISLRDHVWQVLVDEGADLLNADDVESAARLEWNKAYKAEITWLAVSCTYIFLVSTFVLWRSRCRV